MSQEIEVYNTSTLMSFDSEVIPPIVAAGGAQASQRFFEFFVANIRNPNTRRAYYRTATEFLTWCETHGINDLRSISPVVVAGCLY